MAERLKTGDLRTSLAQAKKELQDLLTRAERLREWISVTEKLCGRRGASNDNDNDTQAVVRFRRTKAAVLSTHIIEVLRDKGVPMHVTHIVSELAKRGNPVTAKNPAATVAVAMRRRADQFVRTGPNIFDLAGKETKEAMKEAG